jgi:hypothetical protein
MKRRGNFTIDHQALASGGYKMTSDYVIWGWRPNVKYSAVLHGFVDFEDEDNLFGHGGSWNGKFPSEARMDFDPEHPRDTVSTDYLANTDSLLVISERLCDFLVKRMLSGMEYLPITIIDHKKKPIAEKYFIAHTVDHVDCLDLKASGPTFSRIRKTRVTEVKQLVLDPKRIDPKRELFRIKNFADEALVSRSLAEAITAAGFTSLGWTEFSEIND